MRLVWYSCLALFGLITAKKFGCDKNLDPADDPKNIERPCPNFDLDCIREYFSSNSKCQIAREPVPDPLLLNHYRLNIANSNITMELNNVEVGGLNGNIVEFYINKETQKLVLVIEVDSVRLESIQVTFKYNRKAKEPIVRSDNATCDYGPMSFTVVFPSICDLDLNNAEVFTYVEDCNTKYTMGIGLYSSLDRVAEREYQKLIASMPGAVLESFITEGKIFMDHYIQYNICNFGLELGCE
ncbi:fibrohexamerin-like [Bombyx mandarina]|uniref:Fibrohexamerin-like n=1 Tax=Bombyx mandarina TaxID=7092 RepID=A0A6J2J9H0_BOMMA|nr:fibrohexamerin-like [Bombyx mandarina]